MSEVKRGYKQTEVGVIPEDWEVCLLDSVAKRGSGHTPDKAHPEYWDGSIKWVSLQDSQQLDHLYIHDTTAKITPAGIANSSARMHSRGTVVLSRDAGVGKSAIMAEDMAVSQHFMAWTCGPRLCNVFLYYWLQTQKPEFERIAMGNTIKTIGLSYFRALATPIPARPEQEAIAEALSDADALIESLEQLLTKKRQIKQGAMQELLTGNKRLPGFQSKPDYKQTEIGTIPEEWQLATLGQLCNFENGDRSSNYPSPDSFVISGVPFINAGHVADGKINLAEMNYISAAAYARLGGGKIKPGDILFCLRGSLGKFGIVSAAFGEGAIASSLVIVRPKATSIERDYLGCYFSSSLCARMIENWSGGAAQPNLGAQDLARFFILLPATRAEQTAIASVLSDMDADIAALETKLAKARRVKQGMMQNLLTGKIRLV